MGEDAAMYASSVLGRKVDIILTINKHKSYRVGSSVILFIYAISPISIHTFLSLVPFLVILYSALVYSTQNHTHTPEFKKMKKS